METNYKPLPDLVTIGKSSIHGLGLIATTDISSFVCLGTSHYESDRCGLPDGLVRTPLGGFINHSNEPNLSIFKIKDWYEIITIKRIKEGDELTLDYCNAPCGKCDTNE